MRAFSAGLVLTGVATAAAGEWQAGGLFLGFGLLLCGCYVGLVRVHRCGGFAPTTDNRVCGHAERAGLLRGCYLHRWWRVKRWLHLDEPADRARASLPYTRTVKVTNGGTILNVVVPPGGEAIPDRTTAFVAFIGLLTGLVTLLSAVLALVIQVRTREVTSAGWAVGTAVHRRCPT